MSSPFNNTQDLFDHVVNALRKQGVQSKSAYSESPNPRCAYRGDNGTKCAAGHCITDEEYGPEMEGKMASGIPLFEPWPEDQRFLLIDLQRAHDNHHPTEWENRWKNVAHYHYLTYTPPPA
jgi:hypothetical protein